MPNPTTGSEARAYRLSTGTRSTWGTATDGVHEGEAPENLTEMTNVGDVEPTGEDEKLDAQTRGSRGHKMFFQGSRDKSLDVTVIYDPADPDYVALRKAYLMKSKIAIAFLGGDKDTVGTEGIWADWAVFNMKKTEPLNGRQDCVFSLAPALSAVPPEHVKVTAGA